MGDSDPHLTQRDLGVSGLLRLHRGHVSENHAFRTLLDFFGEFGCQIKCAKLAQPDGVVTWRTESAVIRGIKHLEPLRIGASVPVGTENSGRKFS